MLGNGFHDVPPGKVATVVTYLEMRAPAAQRPMPLPAGLDLRDVTGPTPEWYRDLFTRVGGQDWLWFSRLNMTDDELTAIITDPDVQIACIEQDGVAQGLLELDFRQPDTCELAFFGVAPALIGGGIGRYLMNQAIDRAWARPINLFHVHTCTLDHPAALGFYRRSGFAPVRQQVEIADDPRLNGKLPRDAGAHVPIFAD